VVAVAYKLFLFCRFSFHRHASSRSLKIGFDLIRGELVIGRGIAPQPCIRSIRVDRGHDAVMRIGGEAPGRQVHSAQRLASHGFYVGSPRPRMSSAARSSGSPNCFVVLPFDVAAYHAGRKTMPSDTWPVVTRRQRAMSSFRANATIIVLRVLPRPSAVRA